jgi:hypothetical protein
MITLTCKVYDVKKDGLLWEANDDVGRSNTFGGIEKYIIFDIPIWNL